MELADALDGFGDNQNQSGAKGMWPGQPSNPSAGGFPAGPQSNWPGAPQPSNPTWPGGNQPTWPGAPPQPAWPAGPQPSPSQPAWPAGPQPSQPAQPAWPNHPPGPYHPSGPSNPSPAPVPSPGSPATPQNLTVPYNRVLPNGVYDKLLITIAGTVSRHPNKFTVDLSTARGDIAFHLNPRFNEGGNKVIVRNSRRNSKWDREERGGAFPFVAGQAFEMKILATGGEYRVAVNNSHILEFKHRVRELRDIRNVSVHGDVTLTNVLVETLR